MDAGENCLGLTERFAPDGAGVLDGDRVALLGHDAARLHEAVTEPHVAELRRAPQQQILDEAAEPRQEHCRRRGTLEQIIDGRDAAVGVAGRPAETEQVRRELTIDWKPGAGNRARAERVAIGPLVGAFEPLGIALELLDDREQVMGDGGRLRPLGVRVNGEHGFQVAIHDVEQRATQLEARGEKPEDELALPHPVHRHVDVVAAPRRVQPSRHVFAGRSDDQAFDVIKQILAGRIVLRAANLVLRQRVECHAQRVSVVWRDDALRSQHHQVRVMNRDQR